MGFKNVQNFTFYLLLFVVSAFFVYVLLPYIQPIFWATILAVLFYPLNERLVQFFKGRRAIASLSSIFILLVILILPASLLLTALLKEAESLYSKLNSGDFAVEHSLNLLSAKINNTFKSNIDLAQSANKFFGAFDSYLNDISSFAIGVGKTSVDFLLKFIITLYILFFFLKDGDRWVAKITSILPLGRKKEQYLLKQFAQMVRLVFKGSFTIALVQGALGALLFALLGLPSPIVWGTVMAILAFIPALGPALVWAPASVILFLLGDAVSAVVMFLGGALVIGTIDNLLRPYLIGKDSNVPDLLVFLSVLGALSVFGASGVFIGPVAVALFVAVWDLFEKEYKEELTLLG